MTKEPMELISKALDNLEIRKLYRKIKRKSECKLYKDSPDLLKVSTLCDKQRISAIEQNGNQSLNERYKSTANTFIIFIIFIVIGIIALLVKKYCA